jgi:hypothetical protein
MNKLILIVLAAFLFSSCDESEIVDNTSYTSPEVTEFKAEKGLINDKLEGKEIVVAGSLIDLYIVSFERNVEGTLLEFTATDKELPIVMEDTEGNSWDIFGFAMEGPRKGQRLKPTQSLMGYWFSFATFYPGIQIYPNSERGEFSGLKIEGSNGWSVPQNEVRSGGVGKDGIPAVSNPKFENLKDVTYKKKNDLVVGISDGTSVKAYPHYVLDWHEIVNDAMGQMSYSIIYCPLTGTATAWDNHINGENTTFGVSGLLYNTNIVPYDRGTGSNWSQLFDAAIFGQLQGKKPKTYMVLETRWETWKKLYPDSKLMNFNTGLERSYTKYPYGNYKEDSGLLFPVKYLDTRLHAKQRVHALIVNGKARVYRFANFSEN